MSSFVEFIHVTLTPVSSTGHRVLLSTRVSAIICSSSYALKLTCFLYSAQFRSPAVQRYVHDLTTEIGDHIDNITGTLSMFIEIGECGGVVGMQCADMLHRCPNNQVPSAACCVKSIEFVDCGDILFGGHCNYVTVFIQFHWQCIVGFRECFLVFVAGV